MRPDFRLLHGYTISGLAYLNGTRSVKTTDVFPLWNRQSWEEKKEVDFYSMSNHQKHKWGELEEEANRDGSIVQQSCTALHGQSAHHLFPQVFMSEVKQQVSDRLCTEVCGGRLKEASRDLSLPPDPSLDTHVAYWSQWQWSWRMAFCMELMREVQMYAAPLEIFCVQVHMPQIQLILYLCNICMLTQCHD